MSSRSAPARPIAAATPIASRRSNGYAESDYEVAAVLPEPARPNVAYIVTPDKERRSVSAAFVTLSDEMRDRLCAGQRQGEAAEGRQSQARPALAEARLGG